ncbi:Holliday junction resolvase RuvX [Metamycoplasma hyosynoviae]|uniref:Holliday junction resolvase RuvX n=1 Tax=Metamycoplasma hyosynoviae TaxID=29559 RepID=UPI00235F6849|nr:Holliday junction resolvase RuvX [Metamycoplasma hyosynoviae]MDD1372095.1 Holliday junction resolvase RuvX [Metamycoplasma hyosynoviae]
MRKLCLDLGTKTCGFAISDMSETIAIGLENFYFTPKKFSEVIAKVKWYLQQSEYQGQIDEIILGYPLHMSGEKSERSIMVENFMQMLKKEISLPVILEDERQTTLKAMDILKQAGYSKAKSKTKKDSLAAQFILESYLEKQ